MTEYTPKPPDTGRTRPLTPRALRRFMGLVSLDSRTDEQAQPLERVIIEPEARQVLTSLLSTSGIYRSGALFGTNSGGIAHVTDTAHAGYLSLHPERPRHPLAVDARYLLGWSDCLSIYGSNNVDWIGHFIVRPDGLIGDALSHYAWLRRAFRVGLVSADTFFLFIGVGDEQVEYSAYTYHDGVANELTVTLS